MGLDFIPLDCAWLDQAVSLLEVAYINERHSVPALPECGPALALHELTDALLRGGRGVMAVENGRLAGYLGAWPVDSLFGPVGGSYSPLCGHGVNGHQGPAFYWELYRRAAREWVADRRFSHAVTLFAHDTASIEQWFRLGFGMRCVDGIRPTALVQQRPVGAEIRKVSDDLIDDLSALHRRNNVYFRESPLFMPTADEEPLAELASWLREPNHHEWVALKAGRPVALMRLRPAGESFVSHHLTVMNVCGAFVEESERGSGLGLALLNAVQSWMLENKYPLCGVDYEYFNPLGTAFWSKYFVPYTYSLARRIDERIAAY